MVSLKQGIRKTVLVRREKQLKMCSPFSFLRQINAEQEYKKVLEA